MVALITLIIGVLISTFIILALITLIIAALITLTIYCSVDQSHYYCVNHIIALVIHVSFALIHYQFLLKFPMYGQNQNIANVF